MIRSFITYPLQFILLVLVQVLVLNNIQFSGFINPYLYILFILWLPIETPSWLVMVLACFLGLSVDLFTDTMGMHASASIFLAFCRPGILRFLAPRDGYETNQIPNLQMMGIVWFISYVSIATILHHLFLFFIEVFRFSEFLSTFGRAMASSVFTLLLIFITQLFFYNQEARK